MSHVKVMLDRFNSERLAEQALLARVFFGRACDVRRGAPMFSCARLKLATRIHVLLETPLPNRVRHPLSKTKEVLFRPLGAASSVCDYI